jgi:hypothetical protein
MSDEFDDHVETRSPSSAAPKRLRRSRLVAWLVARLYRSAGDGLRARLVSGLLRPLGVLAVAGVAGGAFARVLQHAPDGSWRVGLEDLAHISGHHVFELASFVEQRSPGALNALADLLGETPLHTAAFTTSIVLLLLRAKPPE